MRGAAPFAEIFLDGVRVPVANRVGEENRGWYAAMTTLSFERAGIGATVKYEQDLKELIAALTGETGRRHAREDWTTSLPREIARRYTETRILHNLARLTVSKLAHGEVPEHEASVNQLFGAELHQRLARTGASAFGSGARLWERDGAPLHGAFTHLLFDSVAATLLAGTAEIQRNVIATRGLGLPRP